MKTALCAIAKLENNYIFEWAKHHLSLGFSHIFIYDNNDLDGESIYSVFENTEIEELVTIIDFRGRSRMQLKAYNSCYHSYEYDWFAFIDIDEFLQFNPSAGITSLDQFLSRFPNHNAVVLNWLCFGDCDELEYRSEPVLRRFPTPIYPLDFVASLANGLPENSHVKCIIRSGLDIDWEKNHFPSANPHLPACLTGICNASGVDVENSPWQKTDYQVAYICHYITMSVGEYLRKIKRGAADTGSMSRYRITRFFRYNKITLSKLRLIKRQTGTLPLFRIINERFKWKSITNRWPSIYLYRSFRQSRH